MHKLIAWLPRWVTYVASALATGLLVVVPMVARLLSGPALVACAVAGFVLGVVGFGGSALKQHQERHDARLDLELSAKVRPEPLPRTEVGPALDAWCATEEEACLASLDEPPAEPDDPDEYADVDVRHIPSRELVRIEKKIDQGIELTPDEARINAAAKKRMKAILPPVLFRLGAGEPRTVDEYRAEVETHLGACKRVLASGVIRQYVATGAGELEIVLSTGKEKTYEKVEVVLRVEGRLWLQAKDDPPRLRRLPERPTPYGKLSRLQSSMPPGLFRSIIHPQRFPADQKEKVGIEREDNLTTVTYPPVTLRPGKTIKLPVVAVITSAEPGTNFRVDWSATSTSAEGHLKGCFEFRVGCDQVPVEDLLADALNEARD